MKKSLNTKLSMLLLSILFLSTTILANEQSLTSKSLNKKYMFSTQVGFNNIERETIENALYYNYNNKIAFGLRSGVWMPDENSPSVKTENSSKGLNASFDIHVLPTVYNNFKYSMHYLLGYSVNEKDFFLESRFGLLCGIGSFAGYEVGTAIRQNFSSTPAQVSAYLAFHMDWLRI